MARILLGWELGANTGHAVKLLAVGRALAAGGHDPVYAVQNMAPFAGEQVWQAPLWPAQLAILARPPGVTPATMGDILVALGLARPGALAALIGGWDRMLAAIRPDAIVAEFAPALLLAAAGRIPVLSVGSGFTLPPAGMNRFPSLTGSPAAHDEAPLLDGVNAALAANGRRPIERLTALFDADRELPAVFTELDPYQSWRTDPPAAPSLSGEVPLGDPQGDELFVYMNVSQSRPPAFWNGLRQSGLKIRIHDPRLNAQDRAVLRQAGFAVEEAMLPCAQIAARSRLVLSHCGLGFVSSALLAGLPQILVPVDLEKGLNAAAVTRLGLGRTTTLDGMEGTAFAALLRDTAADSAMTDRARAAAPNFRARATSSSDDLAGEIVVRMASGEA